MIQKAEVYIQNILAGYLLKKDNNYEFQYDLDYLNHETAKPVAISFPLTEKAYKSKELFPFFDGLLQEGWLLNLSKAILHLDEQDRFNLLLKNGADCIGDISLKETKQK